MDGKLKTPATLLGQGQDVQLLTFTLADQEYALPIAHVVQVVRMVAITPAPKAPAMVAGMLNLRGTVIPVIDLRKRFDLRPRPYGLDDHLLIARTGKSTVALMVDAVTAVLTTPASNIELPSEVGSPLTQYISAVGKLGSRLLLILDLDKVVTIEEGSSAEQILSELGKMLAWDNGKHLSKDWAAIVATPERPTQERQ